ncbi:MAG: TraB/GumN family protein [Bacteroidota bacterium]
MKFILRLLLLETLVFLGFVLNAQPPVEAPPAVEVVKSNYAPTSDDNYLLWEISGKNLTTPSYLYGTIHLIPEEDYFLSETTQKAFDSSQRIAFEIDTEDMMNPASMMGLMSKMYMNDDLTLADLLEEEEYKMVADHFEEMGLPMMFMGRIKPMFLSILAGQDMESMKPGEGGGMGSMMGEGMKSYELELTERAKELEKPIVGLETAEFQMSLFDSIPYDAQAKMLVDAIENDANAAEEENMLDEMVELYKQQNIVAMVEMMGEEEAGIGGFEDLLLLQRNRNWIPVMEELMAKEKVFFAVGAGHLAGEEGVIALLRKAGYKVEAM